MEGSDRRARTIAELQPYIQRAGQFSGWTFDMVRQTPLGPDYPWDYEAIAREHARPGGWLLDIGTGGGEVLSRIVAGLDVRAVATEEWHVNVPVAQRRLAPLGVRVMGARSESLPFREATFDLALSRHEGFDPHAFARLVRPGGAIVTQQVDPSYWKEQRRFFPRRTEWGDHFTEYTAAFEAAGLAVRTQRHERQMAYATLGDVVFMMLVTPWEVADFDPVAEIDQLLAMEDALRTPDGIVFTEGRHLIVAERPA
jgi:SAM-dependent methyltransferase